MPRIFSLALLLTALLARPLAWAAGPEPISPAISAEGIAALTEKRPVTIDTLGGERLIGVIDKVDGGNLHLTSTALGPLVIPAQGVRRISTEKGEMPLASAGLLRGKGTAPAPAAPAAPPPAAPGTIGQAPEKSQPLFLKESQVLLQPRSMDLDTSLSYKRAVLKSYNDLLGEVKERRRMLLLQLGGRVGVLKDTELTFNVPLAYIGYEHVNSGDPPPKATASDFGFGDLSAGLKYNIVKESAGWPSLTGFVNLGAPTGSSPYQNGISAGGTGSGHWRFSGGLTFVKSFDPVVFFGGASYDHYLPKDIGQEIQPGWAVNYFWGLGLAINDTVNTSWQIQGSYQDETYYAGNHVAGTSSEPLYLRWGVDFAWTRSHFLEPFVTYGINDDSADVTVGITYTARFNFLGPQI